MSVHYFSLNFTIVSQIIAKAIMPKRAKINNVPLLESNIGNNIIKNLFKMGLSRQRS